MNSMKRQKDMTQKDEIPSLVGAQYATGEEWRNSSRRNEEAEPKQKQHPAVDVSGGESKVQCCKVQYWQLVSRKFKSMFLLLYHCPIILTHFHPPPSTVLSRMFLLLPFYMKTLLWEPNFSLTAEEHHRD